MTDAEINREIARHCGCYLIGPPEEDGIAAFSLREPTKLTRYPWRETEDEAWADGPDYYRDLNAMAEAERTLEGSKEDEHSELSEYHEQLYLACGHGAEPLNVYEIDIVRATASQRATAFLRAIGKWKE